jgi:MEMO1 family protein
MMTLVRHAAVAGMFYPGNPRELDSVVRQMLADAAPETPEGPAPKAIIAPHAGYVYSGPIAATAYARLKPVAGVVRRVVLLGPCHRVPVRGLAVSAADAFETPLGRIPVDRDAVDAILSLPQVQAFEATHADEHSLEVHLPFLQEIFADFSLVPLVVGQASADEVAEVLERLWGGPETIIVISSDLSHYLDYESARHIDAATCRAIEALEPAAIGYDQACGRVPVSGLLTLAKRRGLRVTTLDLRNSGDTAGDRRRVVGYGAWMFTEPEAAGRRTGGGSAADESFEAGTRALLVTHGKILLHVAAASIEHGLARGKPLSVDPADYPQALRDNGACFVTLKRNGQLRGCVGSPRAYRPLVEDVADNGFAAAFRDSRFPKLGPEEKQALSLSVSVLSPPAPMTFADEADLLNQLRPGIDGLIIESDGNRALFLPQVWETLPRPQVFLAHLKVKAGLDRNHWSPGFKAWRFTSESVASQSLEDPEALWN